MAIVSKPRPGQFLRCIPQTAPVLLLGLYALLLLPSVAFAQFGFPSCPGRWVSGGGGMMCLCPDGSLANGYPAVCPTARAPNNYYRPPAPPPDPEAERKAEAERLARQRAAAEEAQRKHDAEVQRTQSEHDAQVLQRAQQLQVVRQQDGTALVSNPQVSVLRSNSLLTTLNGPRQPPATANPAWQVPTAPSQQQVLANQESLRSVFNDPTQSTASRRLAGAVLGASVPSTPNTVASSPLPASSQMTQAERELAAIAYGKQIPASTGQPLSLDAQLRVILNNPKETSVNRQIAAIALGVDPKTIGIPNGATISSATRLATSGGAATSTLSPAVIGVPSGAPATSAKPPSAPGLQLNPNLKSDIATLSPPVPPAQKSAPPPQNQWVAPQTTFQSNPSGGLNISALDSNTAKKALPYALMSRDANNDISKGQDLGTATDWKRTSNWDSILQANGASTSTITAIRNSGFFAAIYQNQKTGDVAVAFRATQITSPRDLATDAEARFNLVPIQYQAASSLASVVKGTLGLNHSLTLTGYSLGGGLASYAANDNGIKNVMTFNPARNYLSDGSVNNPSQLNFYSSGELIGDPNKSGLLGSGQLPGQNVMTNSNVTNGNIADDLLAAHSIDNIIGSLSSQALQK